MAFQIRMSYEVPPGQDFISLRTWVKTLSPEEQKIHAEATARNDALRAEQQELGYIKGYDPIYNKAIWSDDAEKSEINNIDPIWLEYYLRWLEETNTVEVMTKVEVPDK